MSIIRFTSNIIFPRVRYTCTCTAKLWKSRCSNAALELSVLATLTTKIGVFSCLSSMYVCILLGSIRRTHSTDIVLTYTIRNRIEFTCNAGSTSGERFEQYVFSDLGRTKTKLFYRRQRLKSGLIGRFCFKFSPPYNQEVIGLHFSTNQSFISI